MMTAEQIIVVREGNWNWVYYLFSVVIVSTCIFFAMRLSQSLRLLRGRRAFAELTMQNEKPQTVKAFNISLWTNFLFWLTMVVAIGYVLWISFQDGFNGFTSAHITSEKVELNYLWPMPGKNLLRGEIQSVEAKAFGKKSRILEIVAANGEKIKSVSGDADDVRELCKDFLRTLELNPQKISN